MQPKFILTLLVLFNLFVSLNAQNEFWGMTSSGGEDYLGTIFKTGADGTSHALQHSFSTDFPGGGSGYELAEAGNGKLYGVSYGGGFKNQGLIFEYDPSSNTYASKVDFDETTIGARPLAGLVLVSGKLYGMTTGGGANNAGVLFEFDPASGICTKKFDFTVSTGSYPTGLLRAASNGKLYGLTYGGGANNKGVLFEYDPANSTYTTKVDFDGTNGANSQSSDLTLASNGKFYGMTQGGGVNNQGVIFEYDPDANSFSKKLDFDGASKGSWPKGRLMQHTNGKLYGMTYEGGDNNYGVIFEFNPTDYSFQKKLSFNGTSTGAWPYGSFMLAQNGKLYGMTYVGATGSDGNGFGILFEYDPVTNTQSVKKNFNRTNGFAPQGNLMQASNGKLYGTTPLGGLNNHGTLFEYTIATNTFSIKIDFAFAPQGSNPTGSLTQLPNGKFFGMTSNGGSYGYGIIFEFDPITKILTKKFDFDGSSSGGEPFGSLTLSTTNKLYGMTNLGGTYNRGTLFMYDLNTKTFEKQLNFSGDNGSAPYADLKFASNGKLYGMTWSGGANNMGVIIEFDPITKATTKKHDFIALTGSFPQGSFEVGSNGKLYGVTFEGGANGHGVIFEYDPSTSTYAKKFDFDGANAGSKPFSGLTLASSGKMYGMTCFGGPLQRGVFYEFETATGTYAKKFEFDFFTRGANPMGLVTESPNGKLYGLTKIGGTFEAGVLFEFDPTSGNVTNRFNFDGPNGSIPDKSSSLVYTKNTQTITFSTLAAKTYGDANFNLSATASSNLPVTYTSSDQTIATISGEVITILKAGSVTITAHQSGSNFYLPAPDASQTLTIGKAAITVTADNKTKIYGSVNPAFTFQYAGFKGTDNANVIDTAPSVSTTASQFSNTGTYAITPNGGVDNNYTFSFIDGYLEVTKANLSAKADDKTRAFGEVNPTFSFTYTGLLGTDNVSVIDLVPTASTVADQTSNVGTYPIVADGGTDNNYAITLVNGVLTITKANQTILFEPVSDKEMGSTPFNVSAASSSGLPVSFATSSTNITMTANQVTLTNPGRATITASQAGNISYEAAISVAKSFCVIPFKPIITSSNPIGVYPILTSSASQGNQWYFNGNPIENATGTSVEAIFSGAYKVQVKVDDCTSSFSDELAVLITGDIQKRSPITVYPNPSRDHIFIYGLDQQPKEVYMINAVGKQKILQLLPEHNQYQADISDIATGTYVIKLVFSNTMHHLRLSVIK